MQTVSPTFYASASICSQQTAALADEPGDAQAEASATAQEDRAGLLLRAYQVLLAGCLTAVAPHGLEGERLGQ